MRRGKPKVLVVEDDRKTSEIIRACLEQDGFSVDIAYDGPAGLRSALDNPRPIWGTSALCQKALPSGTMA